jgi:hypothetical protein
LSYFPGNTQPAMVTKGDAEAEIEVPVGYLNPYIE